MGELSQTADDIQIVWDYTTLTRIYGDTQSFYPRMISPTGGDLFTIFESEGAILLTRSTDHGTTWLQPETLVPPNGNVQATVPDIIELQNGDLLLAYNTRPPQDNDNEQLLFGIKTIKSLDGGDTWSDPVTVYEGGFEWTRGVWEPFMMQHDDEILLFFANEHPYSESHDQEISLVRSSDNGESWSSPVRISYREGFRDGMPVPLILQGSGKVAIAIEDNGMQSSEFKPAIISFPSVDHLGDTYIEGHSTQRWRALSEGDQLEVHEYGGAPYLVQLPSGETVLSFQTTRDRGGGWAQSTMAVAIGDQNAQNFSKVTEPFSVDASKSALWNSLFVKNDSTITALTSTNAYSDDGLREIYSIDGHVLRNGKVP